MRCNAVSRGATVKPTVLAVRTKRAVCWEVRVRSRWFLILVAVVLVAQVAAAQDAGVVVDLRPGQQARGVRLGAPELRLTLKDAVVMSLQHNINIEVARLQLGSADQGLLGATGIFDPVFKTTASVGKSKAPATSLISPSTESRQFDLGIGAMLPTGATYSVGWTNRRTKYSGPGTEEVFYLNPSYASTVSLSLSQPLLQGFGTDVNRSGIEVARRSREISRLGFENLVITTVQSVESAYWNLVYRRENLTVKQQSLKLAQDLLDQTRTRVRIGTSAPIDIVQSEATVAAREQDIIVAENEVGAAADLLKQLLGFELVEDWTSQIVPVDALEAPPAGANLDAAIADALQRRLVLQQRKLEGEISQTNLLVARNNVLPGLDLNVGYGLQGAGVKSIDATGRPIVGGWTDALSQIKDGDYNQWSVGVVLSVPLGNNRAKAAVAQRRFEAETARQNLALERQGVIADVRQAVRGLDASAKSIFAAEKARELAARNLDAEQKKFANGMSTNYQVLKIQEDLATAQAAELNSRVAYRIATVLYHVAVGDLLTKVDINISDKEPAKEPHTFLKDVGFLKYGTHARAEVEPAAAAPAQ
jgi:outer membrane protein TolC